MVSEQSRFFNYKEASNFLRISERKLKQLVSDQRIPVCNIDGRVILEMNDLVTFARQNKRGVK